MGSNHLSVCPSPGELLRPSTTACVLALSQPPHLRMKGCGKLKSVLCCCWEEETRGTRTRGQLWVLPAGSCPPREPALLSPSPSPSWGRQCPSSPTSFSHGQCWLCSHSLPCARLFPFSSPFFFLLFFFLFFFPNTSPRNARGGGSTISHCGHLSLYCSARQNTALSS